MTLALVDAPGVPNFISDGQTICGNVLHVCDSDANDADVSTRDRTGSCSPTLAVRSTSPSQPTADMFLTFIPYDVDPAFGQLQPTGDLALPLLMVSGPSKSSPPQVTTSWCLSASTSTATTAALEISNTTSVTFRR